jgi:hypothetical protein
MRPKLIAKEHTNLTDQDIDGIPDGKTAVASIIAPVTHDMT